MKLDLIRDILDKQLVDRHGTPMGRADGVVIAIREDEQPVVDHLQLGGVVLARRIGRRTERLVQWFRHRWPVRSEAIQIVRWPQVTEITRHDIRLDVEAEETPAMDWERWLRKRVVEKIPGSSR